MTVPHVHLADPDLTQGGRMNDRQMSFDDAISPPAAAATRANARTTDPWTSHAAARSISEEQLRESQRAVLECFRRYGPMQHSRLVENYRAFCFWPSQSESGLRTRTHELVEAGFLRDSGDVVVLPSGRRSIVWEVAP